eukprot:NODE_152_length_15391_cov_0.883272.p11 type:complete len:197 gc:universal NODE_152_length_15391_cov_0.883272:7178-7768(+)
MIIFTLLLANLNTQSRCPSSITIHSSEMSPKQYQLLQFIQSVLDDVPEDQINHDLQSFDAYRLLNAIKDQDSAIEKLVSQSHLGDLTSIKHVTEALNQFTATNTVRQVSRFSKRQNRITVLGVTRFTIVIAGIVFYAVWSGHHGEKGKKLSYGGMGAYLTILAELLASYLDQKCFRKRPLVDNSSTEQAQNTESEA